MATNRYPDNNRYPRDRSPPPYRRPSNFGGGYPPRSSEPNGRPNPEPSNFPPRDPPRGPKSLGDAPRGPAAGPASSAPSAPRDGRGRGFAGRGEDTPLRNAPPLSSGPAANSHNSWRADRDRDRDREFDRRERRPTPPPRRSPVRETRDVRDQRDFVPRDLDVSRARRNSRDGPPSAGSTYSDPPPGAGSSYRGSASGRGVRGGGFVGRQRPFHNDDRDRHHDPRERDRTWRRSRSPPPVRRDRDVRDDRRDDREPDRRDDRRFVPREYDSYVGPAGAAKPSPRALDTHRDSVSSNSRYIPGTPTGPPSHSTHHASPSDRLGSQADLYSRRPSVAIDSVTGKDSRRDPGKDDPLLASRAEASRERYAPRPSSPPAAVPAFGSNVWRAPVPEVKASTVSAPLPKPVVPVASAPVVSISIPASTTPVVPTAPKASISSGLAVAPPTGPKADRPIDRPSGDAATQERPPAFVGPPRTDASSQPIAVAPTSATKDSGPTRQPASVSSSASAAIQSSAVPTQPVTASTPNPAALVKSLPQGPAPKPRPPPIAPQAAFRAHASPQFSRAPFPPHAPRDASPNTVNAAFGPRSAGVSSVNTSPKSLPANIPTGPKADRAAMAARPPPMYPPPDRSSFSAPRAPISGGPKSMQWVRPGLMQNRPSVPTKREFPNDDRDRMFGNAPKAPRLDSTSFASQSQCLHSAKSESPSFPRGLANPDKPRERAVSAERPVAPSPNLGPIETRRHSDVFMAEASPRLAKPLMSAASSAPEVMQDSDDDDDLDLDEGDFAGSEAKYNREREILEARKVDLSAPHLRAVSPLQDLMLLHCLAIRPLPAAAEETEAPIVEVDVTMKDEVQELEIPAEVDQESSPRLQISRDSVAPEPLTPKADEGDDVDMDIKEERPLAPATVALRLGRCPSSEQDSMPDLSSLPYLGSGPPTPISDIELDRPKFSESVMLAIRDKLRKSIEPDTDSDGTLQQYAVLYQQWRNNTRPLDEEREQDEQDRQPSAEPSLKATTPDVTTAAMAGFLEPVPSATGRRSHAGRWATEHDLEQALKESLKTAEEERTVKKDKEPRRAMADPEKEAELPLEIIESEAQRRRYIDTNFQREPGQGVFVFHYEPPEDDFTEEEHRVMVYNYRDQYAKKWGRLAEILHKETGIDRTYKHCINHYYATKWGREYKGKLRGRRAGGQRKRGGAVGRGRGAIANMDRPEAADDGPLPLTETGRPRRSAAPTFGPTSGGNEIEFDLASATITPGRARRQTDADGTQEKVRRGKTAKEKGSRKAKNMPLAAAPAGSPMKLDRKDKAPSLKAEDDFGKRPLSDALMPMSVPLAMPMQTTLIEDPMLLAEDSMMGMPLNMMDRPKTQAGARPGPSSYWSVSELGDFDKNVAHFGTDWLAISNHMGTKTHTMIKNQYLRLIEQGRADLEQVAIEADARRNRGERMGPAPTPTPAPKRRYESTQTALPRQIAPTPELHKSPPLNPLALPKTTPPHSATSSRFSTIAQAPTLGKPLIPVSGFPPMPESGLTSIPSLSQQQSPPAPPQRAQVQHLQSMSQHKPQHPGPRAGYFTEEVSSRHDTRPPSQALHQQSRLMQQGVVMRGGHEPHQQHPYRAFGYEREREGLSRSEMQQDQDAQHRHQQHHRRISQEMSNQRAPFAGGIPPLMPPQRSSSIVRSPEHRSLPYSHGRHLSQAQGLGQSPLDQHPQQIGHLPGAQQVPNRASILTPPVKEEPRQPPSSSIPPAQPLAIQSPHVLHAPYGQPAMQSAPAPPKPKAAPEPRKFTMASILNDDPEEPVRKKVGDQGPSSHSTTPHQQMPIAPPPPPQSSLPPRRNPYEKPYERPTYAPPASSSRTIDLTNDQAPGGRPSNMRDPWQPRQQQYMPNHSQSQQSTPVQSHSGLPQPLFGDSRGIMNHRSVFAQHNAPRHNPSPPPHAAYNNSPHMHSRTPSISAGPNQPPRHAVPNTTAPSHAASASASALVLQPNPYAQVDPSGTSAPPTGPRGMRPSPHLHTSHVPQQRDAPGRNDLSQSHNSGMTYSNPQTPNEHPSQHSLRGPGSLADPYRPRDPRDIHHDFEARIHSDRDTGRELAQRADTMLREQQSNPVLQRTNSLHEDLRYQQERGYLSQQRSHTPLARADQAQPPTLQHPPNSSLGTNNHSLPMSYGQRPPPEEPHRFTPFNPRDRSFTERLREDQAQQMQRDDYARREESQRDRDIHMRDQQMRENLIRRDMRAPPPGSGPGPAQDQRPLAGPPHDWASAVRHPNERHGGWPR